MGATVAAVSRPWEQPAAKKKKRAMNKFFMLSVYIEVVKWKRRVRFTGPLGIGPLPEGSPTRRRDCLSDDLLDLSFAQLP